MLLVISGRFCCCVKAPKLKVVVIAFASFSFSFSIKCNYLYSKDSYLMYSPVMFCMYGLGLNM